MTDLKFAFRQLAKAPGFTAVAILTLALGIGANTAIFSVVYGVLLRPLPYPEQERLVTLSESSEQVPGMSISYPNYLDWNKRQTSFTAIGVSRGNSFNYESSTGTERLRGIMASHPLFAALGIPALRGRHLSAEDDRLGAERAVVISESFWKRSFRGSDSALGEKIRLSGEFYTIVGILPDTAISMDGGTDIAVPLGLWGDQFSSRSNHASLYAVARLKPGIGFSSAEAEMRSIATQLAQEFPAENARHSIEMQRYTDRAFGSMRTALYILLGAAAFVLLIACANVANLQLARAQSRNREFSIRAALGAGRGRIVRQLLVESTLLGLAGSIAGIALGAWAMTGLRLVLPAGIPRLAEVSLNGWVLAFSIAAGLLTSLIFGLAPVHFATNQDLRSAFTARSGAAGKAGGRRWRTLLIVGEFALTCLLVAGASLMLRTLSNLYRADLGYATEHIVTFDLDLAGSAYRKQANRLPVIEEALTRMAALPGVSKVSVANPLPLRGGNQSTYYVEGSQIPGPGQGPSAERAQVSVDFFSTLDIALVSGRSFTAQDQMTTPRVAIVDTVFAEKYFRGQNPIGKRFAYGEKPPANDTNWLEIVGVVSHIKNFGLRSSTREQTYIPITQSTPEGVAFAVRTQRDPSLLIPDLRAAMHGVVPDQPIYNFRTMSDRFESSISTERLTVLLLGVFAGLALFLAAVGLYGVLNFTVGQRTHEIGVRMALGAPAGSVIKLVLRQGMKLAGLGLALGLVAALCLTRLLQSLLYGVSPFDLATFGGVSAVLVTIGMLACWLPARRASRVNPITALRAD